ncbi:MAG: hypothetical protein AUH11_04630 [Acidobacteria bacterium 13_2_20CM_57_17]|nr:MAG: hypothetical protein AUH11_04630 [Acidobacteria bacterium 13_2_20CM_57_17]OLB96136.1 MAG: hypothetical protein AUI02_02670 [Acidobacteria bacterium 13_2_20CM_2_57_12]
MGNIRRCTPLKPFLLRTQADLPLIARLAAFSFSGGATQIRKTVETTGVNPLEKSCGRQNHESESIVVAAGFSCPVAKNVPSDALKRDSPEALPNGVEAETTAGNSGKLQFRVPCTSSAS